MKLNDNENGNHKENYVLQKDNTDGRYAREERRGQRHLPKQKQTPVNVTKP